MSIHVGPHPLAGRRITYKATGRGIILNPPTEAKVNRECGEVMLCVSLDWETGVAVVPAADCDLEADVTLESTDKRYFVTWACRHRDTGEWTKLACVALDSDQVWHYVVDRDRGAGFPIGPSTDRLGVEDLCRLMNKLDAERSSVHAT